MILEELIGTLVSLGSLLITQVPPISRENLRRHYWLLFEQPPDEEDLHQEIINREYKPEITEELPYYEELNASVLASAESDTNRSVCESLRRSFQVNFVLLLSVVLLGFVTVTLVFVDLNTTNSCIEWRHRNHTVSPTRKVLQILGTAIAAIPLYLWLPASAAMLWGFEEFKKNYRSCLLAPCITVSMTMVYRGFFFEKYTTTRLYRYGIHDCFPLTELLSKQFPLPFTKTSVNLNRKFRFKI